MTSRSVLSIPNPEWEHFSSLVTMPEFIGTPTELRQMVQGMKALTPYTEPVGHNIRDETFSGYQGGQCSARIYSPDHRSQPAEIIAYFHGGGWTIGDLDFEDSVCRMLCVEVKVTVVSIEYRKAPENPFPVAVEDAWAGLLWVQATIASDGRPNGIYLAGSSAGANLSAALSQMAIDRGGVNVKGILLRNPMVCHPDTHPKDMTFSSYEDLVDAPLLPVRSIINFLSFYKPVPDDVRFSPLLRKSFAGLPPAYIQVSGADPLRDDGLNYAQKLEEANVPVRLDAYPGLPHSFYSLPLESAKKCNADLVEGLKWLTRQHRYSP